MQRQATGFILVTLILDATGIGLILPVMPALLQELSGSGIGTAAAWGGLLSAVFAGMQLIFGPILGALSDRYGRRPVLLVSLGVMAVDYLAMALASSLWVLVVTRIVGGITAATQATATAWIADVTPAERKAQAFGLVGAAFGVGFVLGPVLGGLLAEWGTRAPFVAAAALALVNMAWGALVLPETVTDRSRRAFALARANPVGALAQFAPLPGVRGMVLLVFLYEFAFIAYPAIWSYYTTARFGWSPGMVGASLALFGIAVAAVQGGLIRVILARLGDRGTILFGIGFNFLAFVFLVLNTSPVLALIFTPLSALGAVVTPALQGRLSRAVGADRQGLLQGVIASAKSVAQIAAPLAFTQTFAVFTAAAGGGLPGAPFALSAVLMVACLAVFLRLPRPPAPAAYST